MHAANSQTLINMCSAEERAPHPHCTPETLLLQHPGQELQQGCIRALGVPSQLSSQKQQYLCNSKAMLIIFP